MRKINGGSILFFSFAASRPRGQVQRHHADAAVVGFQRAAAEAAERGLERRRALGAAQLEPQQRAPRALLARLARRGAAARAAPVVRRAGRPDCAGVADANRESKLVGTPVAWTCDQDRLLRSSCVICALQCMRSVHWSTQATAVTLVQRQMAMRPLWRRSNAEEGHGHRNA